MLPAAVIDNNGSKVAIFQESTKSIIEISSKGKKSLIPFFKITEDKTPNQYIRSFFDHRTPVDIHYIQDGYLLVYDDCYCTIKKHEKQWKLEKKEMLTYEIVQSQPSQPTQFSFSIQPQNTLKTHDISVVKSIFDQGNNTLYCLYTYKKVSKRGKAKKITLVFILKLVFKASTATPVYIFKMMLSSFGKLLVVWQVVCLVKCMNRFS